MYVFASPLCATVYLPISYNGSIYSEGYNSGVHSCATLCTATDQLYSFLHAYTQLQWQQIFYETNPGKCFHMSTHSNN